MRISKSSHRGSCQFRVALNARLLSPTISVATDGEERAREREGGRGREMNKIIEGKRSHVTKNLEMASSRGVP